MQNCSLFRTLAIDQLGQLEKSARVRSLRRNAAVYLPEERADGALLLAEGRVRIGSQTPEGKQIILAFIEPGELFGELALVQPGHRDERAEAVVDSVVLHLPTDVLSRVMEASPQLSLSVTKLIGMRRRRIERRLRSLMFRTNRERLAHLLVELAETYGRATPAGVVLEIRLSHQELASIIGATREHVTLTLGEMQLAGLLKVNRQQLVIRQLGKLAAGLLLAWCGWAVLDSLSSSDPGEPNYGGITCSRVIRQARAYQDGRLDAATSSQMRAHLDQCAKCQMFFQSMRPASSVTMAQLTRGGDGRDGAVNESFETAPFETAPFETAPAREIPDLPR